MSNAYSTRAFTTREVAIMLKEDYKQIYNLIASGELGSYRVGGRYRIRIADLEEYFAKQNKRIRLLYLPSSELPEIVVMDLDEQSADEQSAAVAEAEQAAHIYAAAHMTPRMAAREELEQRATESGEAERDTVEWWQDERWLAEWKQAERKQPERPMKTSLAHTGPKAPTPRYLTAARVRELENEAHTVRQREAAYIEQFRSSFHRSLALIHPFTEESIKFDDWSAVEEIHDDLLQLGHLLNASVLRDEQLMNYPHNVRVLYWIEPNSLGRIRRYPKEAFVLECAVLSDLERYLPTTYGPGKRADDRADDLAAKLQKDDVERALQERLAEMQRWSEQYDTPVAYVIGLASTTGWDAESIEYIHTFTGESRLIPYLINLIDLRVFAPRASEKASRYLELFTLHPGERKLQQLQQQIHDLLLEAGALIIDELPQQLGASQPLVSGACNDLIRHSDEYEIVRVGGRVVIRFRNRS